MKYLLLSLNLCISVLHAADQPQKTVTVRLESVIDILPPIRRGYYTMRLREKTVTIPVKPFTSLTELENIICQQENVIGTFGFQQNIMGSPVSWCENLIKHSVFTIKGKRSGSSQCEMEKMEIV
jgi:hypothetical protein